MAFSAIIFCAAILSTSDPSPAQTINPAHQQISLPGSPFAAITTADGRYVFVSLVITPTTGGVVVVRQRKNSATIEGIISSCGSTHHMAISKGGRHLQVAVQTGSFTSGGV